MALINCPNCNKEISDKAKVCVGCGHRLVNEVETVGKMVNCPECSVIIDTLTDVLDQCQ
jgi:DNA-directed RNA polymerase subunit RPC12/RpoP